MTVPVVQTFMNGRVLGSTQLLREVILEENLGLCLWLLTTGDSQDLGSAKFLKLSRTLPTSGSSFCSSWLRGFENFSFDLLINTDIDW